jgi:hypothetical protein
MERIDDAEDQQAIVHGAKVFYQLFSNVLRSVSAEQVTALPRINEQGSTHAA